MGPPPSRRPKQGDGDTDGAGDGGHVPGEDLLKEERTP